MPTPRDQLLLPTSADFPKPTFKHAKGRHGHSSNGRLPKNDPDGLNLRMSDGVRVRAKELLRTLRVELKRRGGDLLVEGEGWRAKTVCRLQ